MKQNTNKEKEVVFQNSKEELEKSNINIDEDEFIVIQPFDDVIAERFPDLYEELQSEQGKLSIEILKVRLATSLSPLDLSKKLNMNMDNYLQFEFGDCDIPVSKYKQVLDHCRLLTKSNIQ